MNKSQNGLPYFMDNRFINLVKEVSWLLWQSCASESATVCFVFSLSICYWLFKCGVLHVVCVCVCVCVRGRDGGGGYQIEIAPYTLIHYSLHQSTIQFTWRRDAGLYQIEIAPYTLIHYSLHQSTIQFTWRSEWKQVSEFGHWVHRKGLPLLHSLLAV